ncbi:MAG: precorrin-6A/cobalt-precorrin-6A reductase, partial [Ruminococcus sp.]|nr:precorrin-6A/cobalt-precorrin-6A reductase [Ruminococcus sp.]
SILITKESGKTGGYPEKAQAAMICGTELITLVRPAESGFSFDEIIEIIEREMRK